MKNSTAPAEVIDDQDVTNDVSLDGSSLVSWRCWQRLEAKRRRAMAERLAEWVRERAERKVKTRRTVDRWEGEREQR